MGSVGLFYNLKKAAQLFGYEGDLQALRDGPPTARGADGRLLKSWSTEELPGWGEKIGFLQKPLTPICAALFVTKGGVLKTTLALNIARMAALHNLKVCVVGLDMQADITSCLQSETEAEPSGDLQAALDKMNSVRGLPDFFTRDCTLEQIIRTTDIPNLHYIPETPELVALDQSLVPKNRREYWLKENVVEPLKERYDLILLDCSPNWNRLITNALVACDILISPVECKINNFRNLQLFQGLIAEFRSEMRLHFQHVYVPTRVSHNRRLSQEIFAWYRANLNNCCSHSIRESLQGEESMALKRSLPEYAPTAEAAQEMRQLLNEIWTYLPLRMTNVVEPERSRQEYNKKDSTTNELAHNV